MSNVVINLSSSMNISFNHDIETDISVEDWAEMDRKERNEYMTDVLWEYVEANAVNEETGEYLD